MTKMIALGVFTVLFVVSILALLFCFYMLYRNENVYKVRTTMLLDSVDNYFKLPSYNTMMNYFWIPVGDTDRWMNLEYPECDTVFQAIKNYFAYK